MTTTFRIRPDELTEGFLEKLRAIFHDREMEVVIHELDEETSFDYPYNNPAQVKFLEEEVLHYERGGEMVRKTLDELRSPAR